MQSYQAKEILCMTTLTIKLPDTIARHIREHNIPPERLEQVILHFVEVYFQENETSDSQGATWSDSKDFARRVISNNRALFEELARIP
jgi:hypothetical protein